jgi:hypothetical protein
MAPSADTGRSGRQLRAVAAEEGDLAGEDKQRSADGFEGGGNECTERQFRDDILRLLSEDWIRFLMRRLNGTYIHSSAIQEIIYHHPHSRGIQASWDE